MSDFESIRERYRERTERALSSRLPGPADAPERLCRAIRYVCLNGGKRFRAMLVYACGEIAGAAPEQLDGPAAAVEMIHAYSLVHDDLPAMDDDDLRRGRQTCHLAFDEATAILAGDALQARAFEILSADPGADPGADSGTDSDADSASTLPPARRLRMIETLAAAAGTNGMAGGQALDIEAAGESVELDQLVTIHRRKTGALIRAAARLGGLASAQADEELLMRLDEYAASVGLAFQIGRRYSRRRGGQRNPGKAGAAPTAACRRRLTFPCPG